MTTDFVHSFLFQDSLIVKNNDNIHTTVSMDTSKEGWVGIPHGGIGMGAIIELSTDFSHCLHDMDFKYPFNCRFKMGGAKVKVGDEVTIDVVPTDLGISGSICLENQIMPYIKGEIDFGIDNSKKDEMIHTYMPDHFSQIEGKLEHIPHYRNCFVCGVDRSLPGLKRKFHLWDSPHGRIVCAFSGFNDDDGKSLHLFQRNGFLHPISILAVLDEAMGWAGFMAYANGGVSVDLNYQFLRPIGVDEKLVFFGRGENAKGNINRRMLIGASGCGAVMHEDGSFELVVVSSGQWFVMKALTDQMKKELIPAKLTRKIFSIAENQKGV